MNLYSDQEIKDIFDKYVVHREDGLLNVVLAGESLPLTLIFKTLGLEPERLGDSVVRGINRVDYFCWQVSPGFELEIMVARTSQDYLYGDALKLCGYGVRLRERKV